jgi:hypothetical protein
MDRLEDPEERQNMTVPVGQTPGDEVPDADWMEQQTEAEPLIDDEAPVSPTLLVEPSAVEANEADVLEQATDVGLDDEEL